MDKAEVQAVRETDTEEEQKISHSSHSNSNLENRHIQKYRLKRDRQDAVSTIRATNTLASFLISPQIKNRSCLSKPRRGRMTEMVVMTKITTLMENTTMLFVDSRWKNLQVIWKELSAW